MLQSVTGLEHIELAWEEYNDRHDRIVSAVQKEILLLPPRSREIMLLVFQQGMKYQEVAKQLNISLSTVKNLVAKAVEKLRERLNDEALIYFFIFFPCSRGGRKIPTHFGFFNARKTSAEKRNVNLVEAVGKIFTGGGKKTVNVRYRLFRAGYALLIAKNAVVRASQMRHKYGNRCVLHAFTPISSSAARAASCSAAFFDFPLPDEM